MPNETHHPKIDDLLRVSRLPPERRSEMSDIVAHVESCDDCRARIADFEHWDEAIDVSWAEGLPDTAKTLAEDVYRDGQSATRIVTLIRMEFPQEDRVAHLAADTETGEVQPTTISTFYAERPEVVVRVMREAGTGNLTITVIADDPQIARNAIVTIGNERFVCDESGSCQVIVGVTCDPERDPVRLVLPPTTI